MNYTNNSPALCQLLDLGSGNFAVQPKYPLTTSDTFTCSFTANQPGNVSFLAAEPVSQTITFLRQSTRMNVISPNTVPVTGAFLLATVLTTEGRSGGTSKGITFTTTTPTICTVSEYTEEDQRGPRVTIRPKGNGACSVTIAFAGTGDLKPASATWNFSFAGLNIPAPGSNTSQTIDFPALVDRSLGRSQPLLARATSGLQISYLSLTPSVCFVLYPSSGPAVQTTIGIADGIDLTCTIRASQAGDDRYAPAVAVDRSFKYTKAPMMLQVENAPTLNGVGPHAVITRVRLVDNVAMSGLTSLGHLLTAQSLTPAVCTIQSHGTWDRSGGIVNRTYVVGLVNGTCSLKFDFEGTKDRAPATLTWNATVAMPVDTPTYIDAQIGGVSVPSTGYTISRSTASRGLVTIDVSVKPVDPKLAPINSGGRLSTSGGPLRATFPTNNICSMSSTTFLSSNIMRVVLRLNAEGTCTLVVNFPGVTSMKYFPSSLTWNATITK